jgi:O-antigen biosynthesis protein
MPIDQVAPTFSDFLKVTKNSKKLRSIAIVTTDIKGLTSFGGVATANSAIAESLSSFGHKVTVVIVSRLPWQANEFHLWQLHYADKGIELQWIQEPEFRLEGPDPARLSYASYLHLKSRNFEIVHFSDYLGLAYYSVLAKSVGTDFQNTLICVTLHGPSFWAKSGNMELPSSPEDLLYFFLERKSVELADVLISPTQYFAKSISKQKWKLPKRTFVQPLPLTINTAFQYTGDRKRFKELVFFGRLETRKGLIEFCDALDKLPGGTLSKMGITVVFLGIHGSARWTNSQTYISERSRKWTFAWKIISDFNQEKALYHLASNQTLVVLPSRDESMGYTVLECIKIGAPFLAADIAPFREIISPRDHKKVLCDTRTEVFSNRILKALKSGAFTARPSVQFAKNNFSWGNWHSRIKNTAQRTGTKLKSYPFVSVCLTHRNRPQYLKQSLESLKNQDYSNFEVIIMDDASDTISSKVYLKSLRPILKKLGWKIHFSPESIGPSALRNKGAKIAQGKYVLFMDDDNYAKPHEISTFVNAAQLSNSDIVTCPFDRFKGSRVPSGKPISRSLPLGDIQSLNLMANFLGDMNFFIKRNAFLALGGLGPQGKKIGAEDAEFLARATFKGLKLTVVPDSLFWYRNHDSNFSIQTDDYGTILNRVDPYLKTFENLDMQQLMKFSVGIWYRYFQGENWREDQLFPELNYRIYNPITFFQNSRLFFADKENLKNRLRVNGDLKIVQESNHSFLSGSGTITPINLQLESLRQVYVRLNCTSLGVGKIWLSLGTQVGKVLNTPKKEIQFGLNQNPIFIDLIKASANYDFYTGLPVFNSIELCIEQPEGAKLDFQCLEFFGLTQ